MRIGLDADFKNVYNKHSNEGASFDHPVIERIWSVGKSRWC